MGRRRSEFGDPSETWPSWLAGSHVHTLPLSAHGVYLFRYVTGAGLKYYDQGSGWDCKDLGLSEPVPPVATAAA